MSDNLPGLLERLEILAEYDGPWRPLRRERDLLRQRLQELRERAERLDDLLVVALVGGSGVGKSTLLNALAGDQLARTSEMRPCTSQPTVYMPPGARLPFQLGKQVTGSALERLVIVDTPDTDTVLREHRKIVQETLAHSDLILICGSPEKYLDEATWSLLRPLTGTRRMVCVETKAVCGPSGSEESPIKAHWLERLSEAGLEVDHYFRVNALRALDRKLRGERPSPEECDFNRLERFLSDELDREQVMRIKRSNVVGLLQRTFGTLQERVGAREADLHALEQHLQKANQELVREAAGIVSKRLFSESHLWVHALGHETSLRAKGLVGTVFRMIEGLRALPLRMSAWLPWSPRRKTGRQASALLENRGAAEDAVDVVGGRIEDSYRTHRSELAVRFAKAGFDPLHEDEGLVAFARRFEERLAAVLRGPARDRVVRFARGLTCWPATLLLELPPLAFIGYSAYYIVLEYFTGSLLTGAFFLNALAVLAIILGVELLLLGICLRFFGWIARRRALVDLKADMAAGVAAFQPQRDALAQAMAAIQELKRIAALRAD